MDAELDPTLDTEPPKRNESVLKARGAIRNDSPVNVDVG